MEGAGGASGAGKNCWGCGNFFALKFQDEATIYESSVTACCEDQPISTYGPNSCFSLGSTLDVCKTRLILTAARVQVLVGFLLSL